jgi:hypothetical protein
MIFCSLIPFQMTINTKNGGSSDKKQLLLENDFTLRARLLKSPALFNPYAVTGAGWSQYDNRYGIYTSRSGRSGECDAGSVSIGQFPIPG